MDYPGSWDWDREGWRWRNCHTGSAPVANRPWEIGVKNATLHVGSGHTCDGLVPQHLKLNSSECLITKI